MATSKYVVRLAALGAVGASVLALTSVPVAAAEPSDRTRAAQAQLERLTEEVDTAVEDYNQGTIALTKANKAAERARNRVIAAQERLQRVQRDIGTVAASAYRSGTGDPMLQLMTTVTEPVAFLDRASALDQVARSNAERLRDLRAARRTLTAVQGDASREYAAERALQQRLTKTRDAIVASVAKQERLVASLVTADERAAAERAEKAERLAAERRFARRRAAADLAQRTRLARASRAETERADDIDAGDADAGDAEAEAGDGEPAGDVPANGRASAAVQFAYSQIGKPYSWAADGPGSFDCSGLTMRAWGAAGVSLSHSSRSQIGEGRRVSRSELRPGDLVFFGSPIHHVGIYVGGGQMINAPHSGARVGVRSALRRDYAGAVRPG